MRKRLLGLIAVSLMLAGGAAYMTQGWLAGQGTPQAAEVQELAPVVERPSAKVLVAVERVAAGTILRPEHLRWQTWPEDALVETYLLHRDDEDHDLVGAVVRNAISRGEPITEQRVVRPGDRGFLAAMLAPGKRAISVPVNASSGLSGLVFPGDQVDLLVTHTIARNQSNTGHERRASETVVEDVRILALDQRTDDTEGQRVVAKTATIEVTPKQAEQISLAQQLGSLSLSLRPIAREEEPEQPRLLAFTSDTEISAFVGIPASEEERGPKVRVVRGNRSEELSFGGN